MSLDVTETVTEDELSMVKTKGWNGHAHLLSLVKDLGTNVSLGREEDSGLMSIYWWLEGLKREKLKQMVGDGGHALAGALDGVFADQVKLYCKETSSGEKGQLV